MDELPEIVVACGMVVRFVSNRPPRAVAVFEYARHALSQRLPELVRRRINVIKDGAGSGAVFQRHTPRVSSTALPSNRRRSTALKGA